MVLVSRAIASTCSSSSSNTSLVSAFNFSGRLSQRVAAPPLFSRRTRLFISRFSLCDSTSRRRAPGTGPPCRNIDWLAPAPAPIPPDGRIAPRSVLPPRLIVPSARWRCARSKVFLAARSASALAFRASASACRARKVSATFWHARMTAARYCAAAWSRAASAARFLCSSAPASNSVWVNEAPASQNPV